MTWESEINLALLGLRLRKYIELRYNSAAENQSFIGREEGVGLHTASEV